MRLTARLTLQFGLILAVLIGLLSSATLWAVGSQLEAGLAREAALLTQELHRELRTWSQEERALLDEAARDVTDLLAAPVPSPALVGWAARLIAPLASQGNERILKLLDDDGRLLSSAHWPESARALDPASARYAADPGALELVAEPVPGSMVLSLQQWRPLGVAGRSYRLVGGRQLSERLLRGTASGADHLVVLCTGAADGISGLQSVEGGGCVVVGDAELDPAGLLEEVAAVVRRTAGEEAWSLYDASLPELPGVRIWIGRRRTAIAGVRRTLTSAFAIGAVIALFAAGIAARGVSARLLAPIDPLVDAAERYAKGEFGHRVALTGPAEFGTLAQGMNRMGQAIATTQEQLLAAERIAAWRNIARGLAHEIKNPLTPIQLSIQTVHRAYLRDHRQFPEILEESVATIQEEVGRLRRLTEEFAGFARLPPPRRDELDLAELLRHVAGLYQHLAPAVAIRLELPETLPMAGDRDQLRTAFANLVKNGLEALSEQSEEPWLALRAAPRVAGGDGVRVEIRDNGPGIDAETRGRLFTPYFTTKAAGTGLGLALVQRIVEQHGGTIAVSSEPGAGACFAIELPLDGLAGRD